MLLDDFEEFFTRSVDLARVRPLHTRYTIKYCSKGEGKLVLKVTDDEQARVRV